MDHDFGRRTHSLITHVRAPERRLGPSRGVRFTTSVKVNPDPPRRESTRPSRQPGPVRVNATAASTGTPLESTRLSRQPGPPSSQRDRRVSPDPPRVNATVESTRAPVESTRPSSQPGPRSSQRGRRVNPNAARVNGLDSSQPRPVRVDAGDATFLRCRFGEAWVAPVGGKFT